MVSWHWCLFCFCCHIQHTMFGGSVWLYEAVLLVFALYTMVLSCTYVMYYVLYCVLSYWYLLRSHKANSCYSQTIKFLYSVFRIPCQSTEDYENTKTTSHVSPSYQVHSSGAVWESRWTSWAVRPNEPSGFRGRKELLNRALALVTTCP